VTQPEQVQQQARPAQLTVATQVLNGPDGRPVSVVLMLGQGNVALQIQVDWDRSDALGEMISKKLREAHEQASRAASGLFVADAGDLPRINGQSLG
jgi:DNA-binding protein YbaB